MAGSILLLSDLHADILALNDILEIAGSDAFSKRYGPVEKILNLGDLLERGHHPREVVERLQELDNVVSIIGNHEEAFLLGRKISTPDAKSLASHQDYKASGTCGAFFEGMPRTYVDLPRLLYAAHGGPLDPASLISSREADFETAWHYAQSWQRISETGSSYMAPDGYHYLPEEAFAAVKDVFKRGGFVVVCGHDHREVVYRQRNGVIENILDKLPEQVIDLQGRRIREKQLEVAEDANYLVRLGIGGPEGYLPRGWADRSYFGVLVEKAGRRTIYLLSFDRQRPAHS
ncbi:metallophosphoesterase [Methanocella sp. MCL-LM]|uniref:metallophosphoesterase n=1 Tax=Methanocella sp. MCL-LM TaxID=3412035 RepID=UPI003C727C5D